MFNTSPHLNARYSNAKKLTSQQVRDVFVQLFFEF